SVADVEGTDALRRVELVAGQRQDVHAEPRHVDRNLAGRLSRVRMHEGAVLVRKPSDLLDRLECADLVVRVHDADEQGGLSKRAPQRLEIDDTVSINRQDRDAATEALEEGPGGEPGRLLPPPA